MTDLNHRPFYVTLAFIAVALLGYTAYRFTLQAVNNRRKAKLGWMTAEQVALERTSDQRYADKKYTFMYSL